MERRVRSMVTDMERRVRSMVTDMERRVRSIVTDMERRVRSIVTDMERRLKRKRRIQSQRLRADAHLAIAVLTAQQRRRADGFLRRRVDSITQVEPPVPAPVPDAGRDLVSHDGRSQRRQRRCRHGIV